MSNQNAAPLSSADLFLEPVAGPASTAVGSRPALTHRPSPKPAEYMCTCGKVREACVHDEIRALWGAVGTPGASREDPT
jgi:hypothetical protein